jgi:ribose/xylose/arabinose/galactoside ABC-type transport system permease subunit
MPLRSRPDLIARAALVVVLYFAFASQLPAYFTAPGLAALLDGAVLTGLVAAGVGLTIIAGEMDLSVGSMAALAGVLSIELVGLGFGLTEAIFVVVLGAAAAGALQGYAIQRLKINSLIFTIGTLIGLRGLALVVAHETTQTLSIAALSMSDAVSARWFIFSPLNVILILAYAAVGFLASRTLWGREIYAVGGGRNEARAAGVPVGRPIVVAFTISAALAALGGSLLAIRSGGATPLGYESVLLEAVAACLIGGIALQGGRGDFYGLFAGLLTLRLVISGISNFGAPFWAQNLAAGLLLILVIAAESLSRAIWNRRALGLASRGSS